MDSTVISGKCGDNVFFEILGNNGGLTVAVSGKGEMYDYPCAESSPFFSYADRITEAVIGGGVCGIGDYTFAGCAKLSSAKLSRSVKYIGTSAFDGCTSLVTVTLPEGTGVIGPKAFSKCTALKEIRLPSTLRAVDFKAFGGCTALESVRYAGSEEQWRRCVRVAPSSLGNKCLENARFGYTPVSSRCRGTLSRTAKIIREGGDGRIHILCPDLTVPGNEKKSGEFTVIVFPQGSTMMIDSGAEFAESRVISILSGLKLKKLDYFVLTHPHSDHYGNALAAMKYIIEKRGGSVGTYMYSGYAAKRREPSLIRDYLRSAGTSLNLNVRKGDRMEIDGVHIWIFNPDDEVLSREGTGAETVNGTSIAMKFTYGDSSFIFSGDLYANRETELAAEYKDALRADVIKTNHHGLFTSSTAEWIGAIRPTSVISEDDGADCTRLDERLTDEGIRIYKVSECGLVTLTVGKDRDYSFTTEWDRR